MRRARELPCRLSRKAGFLTRGSYIHPRANDKTEQDPVRSAKRGNQSDVKVSEGKTKQRMSYAESGSKQSAAELFADEDDYCGGKTKQRMDYAAEGSNSGLIGDELLVVPLLSWCQTTRILTQEGWWQTPPVTLETRAPFTIQC